MLEQSKVYGKHQTYLNIYIYTHAYLFFCVCVCLFAVHAPYNVWNLPDLFERKFDAAADLPESTATRYVIDNDQGMCLANSFGSWANI